MISMTSLAAATIAIAAAFTLPIPAASAADVVLGDLVISNAWTRVTPPGSKVAGGFLTITNNGKTPDRLIGGTAEIAGRLEVHEMSLEGGVMKMQELPGGLEVPPGETVELKPGGYHVMFMDLQSSPVAGTPVAGTLKFDKAGETKLTYQVAPSGAKSASGADDGAMHHGQMRHDEMKHGSEETRKMQDHKHGH